MGSRPAVTGRCIPRLLVSIVPPECKFATDSDAVIGGKNYLQRSALRIHKAVSGHLRPPGYGELNTTQDMFDSRRCASLRQAFLTMRFDLVEHAFLGLT